MVKVFEIGRVCMKIAGRDAGGYCVVEKIIDDNYVQVLGPNVRARRVNIDHLYPTPEIIEVGGDVSAVLAKKFKVKVKKGKKRSAGERPRRVRKSSKSGIKKTKKPEKKK